jgi:hypothetical protein
MARNSVNGPLIPGTTRAVCNRCGMDVDVYDKTQLAAHDERHKALDKLRKDRGLDPMMISECVAAEEKNVDWPNIPDLRTKARAVFDLLQAEYGRYVHDKIGSGAANIEYMDTFFAGVPLETRYADCSGLAFELRRLLQSPPGPYSPIRVDCEAAVERQRASRRRRKI